MNSSPIFDRRHFLKVFTLATACSSLPDKSWRQMLAAEIKPLAASAIGTLRIKLQDFPALASESGSVRLALNPINGNAGPAGQFYPVIINRGPDETFFALNSRCTHQGCIVEELNPANNRMNCRCHNSVFAIDGRRISGPATSALARYNLTRTEDGILQVDVLGLGFSVSTSVLSPSGRLRLEFRALRNVTYEVHYRERIDGPGVPVPFSPQPDGTIEQLSFVTNSTQTVGLHVERGAEAGFFVIAIRPSVV